LDLDVTQNTAGTALDWLEWPAALFYDVVRGGVGELKESGQNIDMGNLTCILAATPDATTFGHEDATAPEPGQVFFYLVAYHDESGNTGYGEESVSKPRLKSSGGCP